MALNSMNVIGGKAVICLRNQRILGSKTFKKGLHGIVIGCYDNVLSDDGIDLTSSGDSIDNQLGGKLKNFLRRSEFKAKPGKVKVFHGLDESFPCIAVAGLGQKGISDVNEDIDQDRENIRIGIAAAVTSINNKTFDVIQVDSCSNATAAAEGCFLKTYSFDRFKIEKAIHTPLELLKNSSTTADDESNWNFGYDMAHGQNLAKELMEIPSNYKYPALLAELIQKELHFMKVKIREKDWIVENEMGCLIGVSQGSIHEPRFVEIIHNGANDDTKPVVLVGKGVTFDSGGISIKPSNSMGLMRGDMGGAACVVGAMKTISSLNLPINVVALLPLCENMPSGSAIRPGDVLTAMNQKTIEVDNTDAEGRLILADALVYAHQFKPSAIIDLATLTGAIDVALGAGATGFYSTSSSLWNQFYKAGVKTGDRMWRMPLFQYYSKEMECSTFADLRNTQKKARSAGSPTAAAFLKEFVEIDNWAHLDIAGVMTNEGDVPYLGKGMSGRPTRTLIEALIMMSKGK